MTNNKILSYLESITIEWSKKSPSYLDLRKIFKAHPYIFDSKITNITAEQKDILYNYLSSMHKNSSELQYFAAFKLFQEYQNTELIAKERNSYNNHCACRSKKDLLEDDQYNSVRNPFKNGPCTTFPSLFEKACAEIREIKGYKHNKESCTKTYGFSTTSYYNREFYPSREEYCKSDTYKNTELYRKECLYSISISCNKASSYCPDGYFLECAGRTIDNMTDPGGDFAHYSL